ncbi:hypothetical protein [Paenibacillus sanfengchensis]|uniref:hypothetical protein n=1 Tax=Paenibacillus sanfengchensis TaxID=3119819 RepID=UPI002FE0CB1B
MNRDILHELDSLKQSFDLLVKRVDRLEKKLAGGGSPSYTPPRPSPITLYIDCDTAVFKDGLRPSAIDFLRWSMTNFHCYLITSLEQEEFKNHCMHSNADDLYAGITYINAKEYKSKADIVDIYDDFYCITTNKYPESLMDLSDTHYNDRVIKINKMPFDEIREKIRSNMNSRIDAKLSMVEAQNAEVFSLFKSGEYFGGRGGRGWTYEHIKNKRNALSIDFVSRTDFIVEWSLQKKDKDDWVKESKLVLTTNTYMELLAQMDLLPNLLTEINQQLSNK